MKNPSELVAFNSIKFIAVVFISLALVPVGITGEMESERNRSEGFTQDVSINEMLESAGQNKGLFSDYHIRYIIKGRVSFNTEPPIFTTETGKIFKITSYPDLLTMTGDEIITIEGYTKQRDDTSYPDLLTMTGDEIITIEGYTKQRDDTSELIIKKILPPDTLENTTSSEYIKNLQRDSKIISQEGNTYTLTNIAWSMKHDAQGQMAKDEYGNPVTMWQSGIKVDVSKVKNVYFGKKTSLKPIRYGNHGVLMITFEPGGVIALDGSQVGSLAFSVDAYYTDPTQMVYSMLEALKGKYQVYYSIYSADSYSELKFNYNEFNMSNEMVVVPYPLLLNKEEKMLLLDNAIVKATGDNKGEMYSVLYNSCANSILSIINSALPDKRKIKSGRLSELFYRLKTSLPGAMAALLVKKGVADKPLPDITPKNYKEYLNRLAPGATIKK